MWMLLMIGPPTISLGHNKKASIMKKVLIFTSIMSCIPLVCRGADDLFDEGLWELSPEELGQIRVTSIASGTPTPLDKAAAIATVITAEDIERMGATDLDHVLETVPGLHVTRSELTYAPRFIIRGIASQNNPQTLVLVNGVPVTNLVFGNRGNVWGGMPLKSISKIEVIRGPGSALYGADAFAGVINIHTKGPEEISGFAMGAGIGSFDTKSSWMQFGGNSGQMSYSASIEYVTTDGHKETISQDAQTALDQVFGTDASEAPGPINAMRDMVESRVEFNMSDWTVRLGHQGRYNVGTGPGLTEALDNNGRFASNRYNLDITKEFPKLFDDFSLVSQISYYQDSQEVEDDIFLFPPGAFGGTFPDAFIGNPEFKEEIVRLNLSSLYEGFANHLVRTGVGGYWGDVYEVKESKNFNPDFSPKSTGTTTVDDTDEIWLPEKERTNLFAYIQDEWKFAENWQLITGVRFDHYSDFGDTTNPRLSLIWATTDDLTTKFLYGRAFRAPSLQELFVTSNPVSLGNPSLKPEIIDSYEIGVSYQADRKLLLASNLFYYEIRDFINFVEEGGGQNRAQNIGRREGYGAEFEFNYELATNLKLVANYSYQRAKDRQTDNDVGSAPNHEVYGRLEYDPKVNVQFGVEINWVGEQKRQDGDERKPTPSYTTLDVKYTQKNVVPNMNISVSILNLTDVDVREPSPSGVPVAAIAEDYPSPGRSFTTEVSYSF